MQSMGNLGNREFERIWNGPEAERVRSTVGTCTRECLMEPFHGTHEGLATQAKWVVRSKIRMILGIGIDWSAWL